MRSPEGWANASLRQAGVGQLKRSDNAEELAIALPNMRRRCNYTLHSSLQYTAAGTHFGQEIQALGTEGGQLTVLRHGGEGPSYTQRDHGCRRDI